VPAVLLFLAGRASTGPAPAAREWQAQRLGGAPISLQPVISPDGQTLAFQAMVNGTTQIGVMKLDGAWRVLTNDTTHGPIIDLCWSSDGTRIYFDRVLDAPVGIFSVSVFGEDARPVLENASTPRALPDGSMLVVRINADRNRQLYRFWPGSSPPRLEPLGALLNNDLVGPAAQPFPDGREAAFHGRPADRAAEPDAVHAIDLATGRTRRLAPSLTVPESNWMFPLATTADRALVVIQAGDLHRIVALPRDGSDRFETVTTVSQRPLYVQAAADGSLFTDQVIQSHELRRYSVPGYRLEDRLTLGTDSDAASLEPAPLADGRVLFASRQAGRLRVMVVSPGRAPASFVQSAEESSAPVALVGTDRVALLLGRPPNRKVAIVSAADGRVIRVLGGVDGNLVTRMAGSPDGRQLYFAAGGRVSSISTDDGSPRVIHAGAGVAVDPLGRYIVIQIRDAGETQLLKWPLPDGPGEPIRPSGGFRFAPASIAGHAVARDGRIAVKIASNGSWYWALGILDARTGAIDKLAPDEHRDMFGGFTATGSILLVSDPTLAGLWRFRPVER
jgi:hypothetical protein